MEVHCPDWNTKSDPKTRGRMKSRNNVKKPEMNEAGIVPCLNKGLVKYIHYFENIRSSAGSTNLYFLSEVLVAILCLLICVFLVLQF